MRLFSCLFVGVCAAGAVVSAQAGEISVRTEPRLGVVKESKFPELGRSRKGNDLGSASLPSLGEVKKPGFPELATEPPSDKPYRDTYFGRPAKKGQVLPWMRAGEAKQPGTMPVAPPLPDVTGGRAPVPAMSGRSGGSGTGGYDAAPAGEGNISSPEEEPVEEEETSQSGEEDGEQAASGDAETPDDVIYAYQDEGEAQESDSEDRGEDR